MSRTWEFCELLLAVIGLLFRSIWELTFAHTLRRED